MKKSLNTIQKIYKICAVVCKVLFIVAIVGTALTAVALLILSLGFTDLLNIEDLKLSEYILENTDFSLEQCCAIVSASVIYCGSEIAIMFFSKKYFANELKDGTPFTLRGSAELKKLGIITIIASLGASILSNLVYTIIRSASNVQWNGAYDIVGGASLTTGLACIFLALIYRYVAEKEEEQGQIQVEVLGSEVDEEKKD